MRIAVFGCGNMAEAIVLGMNKGKLDLSFYTYTPSKVRAEKLAEKVDGQVFNGPQDLPNADIYLLGFKPQQMEEFSSQFHGKIPTDSTVISILAGTNVATLIKKTGVEQIVRIMPNTPSLVGAGVNAIYFSEKVSPDMAFKIQGLFELFSKVYVFEKEEDIDIVTPVSGSGPAYVFEMARILTEILENLGIDSSDAKGIVKETLYGSAKLLKESEDSAIELRNKVTSKGGVTFEALEVFKSNDLEGIFGKAIKSAHTRAKELSK